MQVPREPFKVADRSNWRHKEAVTFKGIIALRGPILSRYRPFFVVSIPLQEQCRLTALQKTTGG